MFYNGLNEEVSAEFVAEEFENYIPWKDAAAMIDLNWTSHYLHKQKAVGRIDKTKILYVINKNMAAAYPSTGGKKMFLHRSEIERFKRDVLPTIKRHKKGKMIDICRWCRVDIKMCMFKPCPTRVDTLIVERAKASGMGSMETRALVSKSVISVPVSGGKKK